MSNPICTHCQAPIVLYPTLDERKTIWVHASTGKTECAHTAYPMQCDNWYGQDFQCELDKNHEGMHSYYLKW